jgi:RNA polymerase sigma factor (sigma-70 family)
MKAPSDLPETLLHVALDAVGWFLSCQPRYRRYADDLQQEALLAIARAYRKRPGKSEGYFYKSVTNAITDYAQTLPTIPIPRSTVNGCKRDGREVPEVPREVSLDTAHAAEADDPQALGEMLEELEACCADDDDRRIVRMRHESYTVEEIAQRLGFESKSAISKRLAKIEKRFRIRETN